MEFTCNICGQSSVLEAGHLRDPELPSCSGCGSNVRFRWLAHRLSRELFGRAVPMGEWPVDGSVHGLGLTDPEVLAGRLAGCFRYVNTYYDAEPRFDIRGDDSPVGELDFLIASEVFEHVTPPVEGAFRNAARLLKADGVMLLTVPWVWDGDAGEALPEFYDWRLDREAECWVIVDRRRDGQVERYYDPVFDGGPGPCLGWTREHFPELYDWALQEEGGRWTVENCRRDGTRERFENAVFHSGPGQALEMRLFTRGALEQALKAAGFAGVEFDGEEFPEWGIVFPYPWSLPVVARRDPSTPS